MKAYKGFRKDMKCYNDFQYREGETYSTDEKPVRCAQHGFHSCENPVDVLKYYSPAGSVYHEVEGMEITVKEQVVRESIKRCEARVEDRIPLPKPIPCKGAQGVWNVPDEIAKQIDNVCS